MSLDGFIADANDGADWIVSDRSIDFKALFSEFDTLVMGRRTHDQMKTQGGGGGMPGVDVVVFSRTLPATTQKGFRIVNDDPPQVVKELKAQPGRDIWLFGGGSLFRTLLDAKLVDSVELAVMPVLIGSGVPVLQPGDAARLVLADQKVLPASGIVVLAYTVKGAKGPAPKIGFIKSERAKKTR
jgi:dihydrofolate reductase